jgi:anti-anti-sigma factor
MLRTHTENETLSVSGLDNLTGSNSSLFKDLVKIRLGDKLRFVEVDCSNVKLLDSTGLGALVSVHKVVAVRNGKVRLNKVRPNIREILELMKFEEIFDINT